MDDNTFSVPFLIKNDRAKDFVYRQLHLPVYLGRILSKLKKEPSARIFLAKVNKKDAPDYYDIIRSPMDLGTMGRKLGVYRTVADFKRDLDLIWENCLLYNTAEYFVDCATQMKKLASQLLQMPDPQTDAMIHPSTPLEEMDRIDAKNALKDVVVGYLNRTGFQKADKSAVNVLVDILEENIIKRIANACRK